MKYFHFITFCIITTSLTAQYDNDSIQWSLSSNDSVSSSTLNLRGKKQDLSSNIPAANYNNGYQKITAPSAGWPSIADTNSNTGFIEFPFGLQPDECYDTTGGNRYCIGYGYFAPYEIKLTGYSSRAKDSVIMEAYFYDTSCYTGRYGKNYKYLGSIIIKSGNNFEPTNINFKVVQENDKSPFEACGAGGKYSALKLYPRTGGNFFIKNVTIAGSVVFLLPIYFTSVSASQENKTVVLKWSIENVQDLQKSIIEKSPDGQTFIEAAIINGPGNVNTTGSYSWIDKYPFEESNFYRIKAFERTGKISLSKVVKVKNLIKQEKISIYPIPVTDNILNLFIKNIPFGKYALILANAAGQRVFSMPIFYTGERQAIINLPKEIVRGMYYISIENAGYKWNDKVVIL